jgi:hypothetical protein
MHKLRTEPCFPVREFVVVREITFIPGPTVGSSLKCLLGRASWHSVNTFYFNSENPWFLKIGSECHVWPTQEIMPFPCFQTKTPNESPVWNTLMDFRQIPHRQAAAAVPVDHHCLQKTIRRQDFGQLASLIVWRKSEGDAWAKHTIFKANIKHTDLCYCKIKSSCSWILPTSASELQVFILSHRISFTNIRVLC